MDEDIPSGMKDGGSHSPRPRRWRRIDFAAPETRGAPGFPALSALPSSALHLIPLLSERLGEKRKKNPQTKRSGGADVSGARQVGLRPSELALHLFLKIFLSTFQLMFTVRRSESEFASKLLHLFVQFSPPTDSPGNLIPLIHRYLHRWTRAARAGVWSQPVFVF